jgi:hypothetical protein
MADYAEQIKAVLTQVQQTAWHNKDAVAHLMSLSRQLIESAGLQGQYEYLNFYCNWTLHPELQRSAVAQRILDRISDECSSAEVKQYNDIILEIIGLQLLRKNLIDLYTAYHIPTFLFESKSGWKGFADVLVGLLLDKPIRRRSPEEVTALRARGTTYAIELRLGRKSTDPAFESIRAQARADPRKAAALDVDFPGDVFWIVEVTKPGVVIAGPFNLPERDSAFKHP